MLKFDTRMDKVHDLVMTRINGNSIMGYPTYVAMLKVLTRADIKDYAISHSFLNYDEVVCLTGTKLEMIEKIAKKRV